VQKENERLKEELKSSKECEQVTRDKIDALNQEISILRVSTGESNEKDKKEFEKKINQYIKEIDKCIAYLSQ
jgi:hypothetical protein